MRITALRFIVKLEGSQRGQAGGNETKTIPDKLVEGLERVGKLRDLVTVFSGLQAVWGQREQMCSEWYHQG